MDAAAFLKAFDRNVKIVTAQADGIDHADSLRRTEFNVNCFNWVVGHIVASRHQLFEIIDGSQRWDHTPFERYVRESEPITGDGPGVVRLPDLLAALVDTQARMTEALAAAGPEYLDEEITADGRSASRTARLFFAYFHDTYHTGQTDVVRQLSGKSDKLI